MATQLNDSALIHALTQAILNDLADNRGLVRRGMVTRNLTMPAGVFNPYADLGDGTTFFDAFADDNVVAYSLARTLPRLLNVIPWTKTTALHKKLYYLSYADTEGASAGTATPSVVADASEACDPGGKVEFGMGDFDVGPFGRLRKSTDERDIVLMVEKFAENQRLKRIDGKVITDGDELDLIALWSGIINDLARMFINGNATTDGYFEGWQRLAKNGYTSSDGGLAKMLDSIVVNWNSKEWSAPDPTGQTLNGSAYADFESIVATIEDIVAIFKARRAASTLGGQINDGDMIISLHSNGVRKLLDEWTCKRQCGGDWNIFSQPDARNFRNSLNGGMYGDGQLVDVQGITIPIVAHDHGWSNEIGIMTTKLGGQDVFYGEFYDMDVAAAAGNAKVRSDKFVSLEGGRSMTWTESTNTCITRHAEVRPRLILTAPYLHARIRNVPMTAPLGLKISSDPNAADFWQK